MPVEPSRPSWFAWLYPYFVRGLGVGVGPFGAGVGPFGAGVGPGLPDPGVRVRGGPPPPGVRFREGPPGVPLFAEEPGEVDPLPFAFWPLGAVSPAPVTAY